MTNIKPEKIADDLLSTYKFSDVEEAYDGDTEEVAEEVRSDVKNCIEVLTRGGVKDEDISCAVEEFFKSYPAGTDLSEDCGVGILAFVDHMHERLMGGKIDRFKSIGPNTSEFFTKINGGLSNVESTHLSVVIDVLNIFAESGLGNEETDAICKHVSERSLPISYMDFQNFFPFLKEAIKITKKGGIKALRKFEKEVLLWD